MDTAEKPSPIVPYNHRDELQARISGLFDRIAEYGKRSDLSMAIVFIVGANEDSHNIAKLAGGKGQANLSDELVVGLTYVEAGPTIGTALGLKLQAEPSDDTLVPFRTPHDFELECAPLLQELRNLGDEYQLPYFIKVTHAIADDEAHTATYLTYTNDPGPDRTPEIFQFPLKVATDGIQGGLDVCKELAPKILEGLSESPILREMALQQYYHRRKAELAEEEAEEANTTH